MATVVNTVSAENQMINSSTVSTFGSPDAALKVLVLGNSITRHGPKADIGWNYDWGMAASAPEKDYVHRLFSMFKESGKDVYMYVKQGSAWEVFFREQTLDSLFASEKAFAPDVIVFRLGENVKEPNFPYFKDALRDLINYLRPSHGRVLFTSCFWKCDGRDTPIREIAEEMNFPCIDISHTSDDMMALGQFEHSGVAAHPSDKGMEMIATKIFSYFKTL